MRHFAFIAALVAVTTACGGSDPEPAPKKTEPAATPAKATPAPAPAPAKEEPKAAAEPDWASVSDDDAKAWLMTKGEEVYNKGGSGGPVAACVTCHQANGEGLPNAFPPLKGSEEWMGDCAKHAGIVFNGLQGEIEVQGKKYNGVMTPMNLTDVEVAAVVTYERNSWGNAYGICKPADVAGARSK